MTNNEVMREEEVFPTEMMLALNPNYSSGPNTEALRDPTPQNAPSETSFSGNINIIDEVNADPLQGVIITIPEPVGTGPTDFTTEWDTLNLILGMGDQNLHPPSEVTQYQEMEPTDTSPRGSSSTVVSDRAPEVADKDPNPQSTPMSSESPIEVDITIEDETRGPNTLTTSTDPDIVLMDQMDTVEVSVNTSDVHTDDPLDAIPKKWMVVEEMWLSLFNSNEELAEHHANQFIEILKKA